MVRKILIGLSVGVNCFIVGALAIGWLGSGKPYEPSIRERTADQFAKEISQEYKLSKEQQESVGTALYLISDYSSEIPQQVLTKIFSKEFQDEYRNHLKKSTESVREPAAE